MTTERPDPTADLLVLLRHLGRKGAIASLELTDPSLNRDALSVRVCFSITHNGLSKLDRDAGEALARLCG